MKKIAVNELPSRATSQSESPSPRPRVRPPQFSLRTMLTAITLLSVLFAFLAAVGIQSVSVNLAIVLYLATIAYAQWTLFGGSRPYAASALVGSLLAAAAFVPDSIADPSLAILMVALGGATFGLMVGSCVDVALLLVEMGSGVHRKWFSWTSSLPDSYRAVRSNESARPRRIIHVVIVGVLVILFACTVCWTRVAG